VSTTPLWLRTAPYAFLLLWSGGYGFVKLGLPHTEPMTFLALRYAVVLVLLAPVFLVLRPRMPRDPGQLVHLAVVGALIHAVYFGLAYTTMSLDMSAGAFAVILALQPILTALIAPRLVGERVGPMIWLGLVLALAGALVVILARSAIEVPSVTSLVTALGALLGITAGSLYEKRKGLAHHPVSAGLVQYAVGLVLVGPAAWLLEDMRIDWTRDLLASLAYLVIGNSLIAITLLMAMIRAGEVSRVSALLFLVPPCAALIAWLVVGEVMPLLAWPGMALAGIGVLLVMRRPRA
jgi:drug/metabolite transporter (DMT)-like permease